MKMTNIMMNSMELSEEELMNVNGGGWFSDALDATLEWCKENDALITKVGCVVCGVALCASGIGLAAGVGLIAVEGIGAAAVTATTIGSLVGAGVGVSITNKKK